MKKLQQGFTIIELTIYIALMSVLILVISRIFISALDIQVESESVSSVQQDGRFIISRLARDISIAENIVVPASAGATTTSLTVTVNGQNKTYSLVGNDLRISDSLGTDDLNSALTDVEELSFQRIGNPDGKATIRVNLTLSSLENTGVTGNTHNFQTTIGTR